MLEDDIEYKELLHQKSIRQQFTQACASQRWLPTRVTIFKLVQLQSVSA